MNDDKVFIGFLLVLLSLVCCYFTLLLKAKHDLVCYLESQVIPGQKEKACEMYANFSEKYKNQYENVDRFAEGFIQRYYHCKMIHLWLYGRELVVRFVIQDKDVYLWKWNVLSMTTTVQMQHPL
ncbi:hypothetical protein [Candidatus Uabimicrobium amorphum]|uniref:Uncharacterized protein n=1 Tax=Uabimicrobium amorphum TaxID=2596890 RepID=A0A5S9F3E0_UABAM|nr:hypothetical protein [Candidatus Uabimicrobium amorphum]BBM84635.1 hypothetical protein UABAM_02996 [Candidatus Uabimicrobium amorphum]